MLHALMMLAVAAVVPTPTPEPTPAATTPASPAIEAGEIRPKRYCVKWTPTGSAIARKTCRSRDDWLAQGFDPLAPAK